jgi:transcriptional regulator with XRE-family HTH domain
MERPPALPEGILIRRAREATGLTVPAAAQAAGMSKARWTQVETGYETRQGQVRRVQAKAGTIAHMAHAVGVTPERLADEGQRQDAAEILREILRQQGPVPDRPPAGEEEDEALRAIMADTRLTLSMRRAIVAFAKAMREANEQGDGQDRDTA